VPEARDLLSTAVAAAQRAAKYIRSAEHPAGPGAWDLKGVSDFVTQVDRDSEAIITETLLSRFPDSTVVGEELAPGMENIQRGLSWVVDPLDGTTNFLHSYPVYAVSVAALQGGQLMAGVVLDVHRDHVYTASAGGGAWFCENRLNVSSIAEPRNALIGTGFPFKGLDLLPSYLRQLGDILQCTSGIRRAGSAALDLVDVALGRFDGFWELSLAPWDVAAGTLLVREAGGLATDMNGNDDVVRQGSVVAGNPAIHRWLLERLRL
jgi:myo-inositol-1(or 4)-monophosphatase